MNASDLSTKTVLITMCCLDGRDNADILDEFTAIIDERYGEGATDRMTELFTAGKYSHRDMIRAIDDMEPLLLATLRGTR